MRWTWVLKRLFGLAIGLGIPFGMQAQGPELTPTSPGKMPPPTTYISSSGISEGLDRMLQPGVNGLFDRFDGRRGQVGLVLHSEFTAASSALPYAMLQRLIWGGFIDAELKQQALDASGESSSGPERAGLEWHNGATLVFGMLPGSGFADWHGYLRASSSLELGLAFTPDLYTLLFYGNAPLAGRDANLEQTAVRYQRTQRLEVGLSMRRPLNHNTRFFAGAGVGLVQGIRYDEAQLDGAFFTASDGSRMDLGLDGFYRGTDSTGRWDEAYGWGWTGSAQLRLERRFAEGVWGLLFADVQDLGSVRWKGPATRYAADSSWSFEGLSVEDLQDLSSGLLFAEGGNTTDSLLDLLGVDGRDGAFSAPLQPLLSVGVQMAVRRMRFGAGYRQRLDSPMRPLFWAQGGYAMAKGAVEPRLNLAHGGWGSWQVGAELRLALVKSRPEGFRPHLRIGATDVLGLLAPSAANGGTAYVQLGARF